jgi:WD40 repeat protein
MLGILSEIAPILSVRDVIEHCLAPTALFVLLLNPPSNERTMEWLGRALLRLAEVSGVAATRRYITPYLGQLFSPYTEFYGADGRRRTPDDPTHDRLVAMYSPATAEACYTPFLELLSAPVIRADVPNGRLIEAIIARRAIERQQEERARAMLEGGEMGATEQDGSGTESEDGDTVQQILGNTSAPWGGAGAPATESNVADWMISMQQDRGASDRESYVPTSPQATWRAHSTSVTACTFSSDEQVMVTGCKSGGVKIWSLGRGMASPDHTLIVADGSPAVAHLSWLRRSHTCLMASSRHLALGHVARGSRTSIARSDTTTFTSLAHDDQIVYAACSDLKVRLFDPRTAVGAAGRADLVLEVPPSLAELTHLSLHATEGLLALGGATGNVGTLDVRTGIVANVWAATRGQPVRATAFTRRTLLTVAGNTVTEWDALATRSPLWCADSARSTNPTVWNSYRVSEPISFIATHEQSKVALVASASQLASIGLADFSIDAPQDLPSHPLSGFVRNRLCASIAVARAMQLVLVGGDDGTATLLSSSRS